MLKTENIVSGYDKVMILKDINVEVNKGEIVSIIGRNGVGKSTFVKTLIGILRTEKGQILYNDGNITRMKPYNRAKMGIGYVPQGHGIFPQLTVEENLRLGEQINMKGQKPNFDLVYNYFPRLAERKKQTAGTMSGGEQAMLSIGRVLIGNPQILLLDEPSEGVQPNIVQQMGEIVEKICSELRIAVLMVEQHRGLIQQITQRGYVMDKGSIITALTRADVENDDILKQYLTV